MAVAEVEDRGSEADLRRKAKLKGKRPAPSRVRELRGFFAHGEAMRACVMVNSDEGLRYAGSWKRGRFHGRGLLTFPARDRYLGWFKYGQRFRRGTFEYGASLFVLLLIGRNPHITTDSKISFPYLFWLSLTFSTPQAIHLSNGSRNSPEKYIPLRRCAKVDGLQGIHTTAAVTHSCRNRSATSQRRYLFYFC